MIQALETLHQKALAFDIRRQAASSRVGVWDCLRQLNRTQWLPRDQIERLQITRLKQLLQHAEAHCPFYRERFKAAGFSAAGLSQLSDLNVIPPLTRREIQDHSREMIADNASPDGMYENHTGGSTGTPLTFFQDQDYRAWALADLWRNFEMCGFEPGMRRAFLWGSDYDSKDHKTWFRRVVIDRLRQNIFWIDTFDVAEADLLAAAKKLVRFKPQLMVGYVSSLTLFAHVVRRHGIEGIRPIAIQSSAETLTSSQRALIEETFGAKVFDRYGCREVGNIAHECDHHEGLHLLAECNHTEFLHDGEPVRPGEVGVITVTNLFNYAMPLIRYQLGDLGRPSDRTPTCGRGLPLMETVEGRSSDVITSPSGKFLHGEFFTHLFYKLEGVRQFQVIQESRERLTVKIEPMSTFNEDESTRFLKRTIREHGDPEFEVTVELVDKIPASKSGKFRFTQSRVPVAVSGPMKSAI